MCLVVFRKGKCRLELNLRCLEKSMENEYEVECGLQLVWFWRSDIFDNIDDIKKIDFVNSQLSMKIPWRAFFASHPTLSIRAVPPETAGCWNWSQKMLFQTDCRFFLLFPAFSVHLMLQNWMKPWGIHGWIVVWYPFLVAGTAHDGSFRGSDGQTPLGGVNKERIRFDFQLIPNEA